ncbi:hypothetical protein UlMin_002833 [Ulmus minor]
MPDLGNLSLSASLAISGGPILKSPADPPDPCLSSPNSLKSIGVDCNWDGMLNFGSSNLGEVGNGNGIKDLNRSRVKSSNGKCLEDHVRARVSKKMESGVSESRRALPFLVGAKKLVDCLVCRSFIDPGEEVSCSVRGCRGVYHIKCVKEKLGICNPKSFKCPQHKCFLCKQKINWQCVKCTIASHTKCSPWPDEVIHLQPGQAVCWRHPSDWRLDMQNAASTSNMEEVFSRLPLPYTDEEFKIDFTWKDTENKMELELQPPSYVHIKRNIYLVKRKRDGADGDAGCTGCSSVCSQDCVCRVQYISCSKACGCSENCTNRPFRKEKKIKLVKTEFCGWGVEAAESIKKGEFIIEYIGEVIDDAECEKRLWDMKYTGVQNFYMCEIRKDFTIDATYKGNLSRFLNHSCDPNCLLSKWDVEGETRVGVFAARSIEVGEPLTYDYRFVQFGPEVRCQCGAPNCTGYLGTRKKIVGKVEQLCWGSKRKRTSACMSLLTL